MYTAQSNTSTHILVDIFFFVHGNSIDKHCKRLFWALIPCTQINLNGWNEMNCNNHNVVYDTFVIELWISVYYILKVIVML